MRREQIADLAAKGDEQDKAQAGQEQTKPQRVLDVKGPDRFQKRRPVFELNLDGGQPFLVADRILNGGAPGSEAANSSPPGREGSG